MDALALSLYKDGNRSRVCFIKKIDQHQRADARGFSAVYFFDQVVLVQCKTICRGVGMTYEPAQSALLHCQRLDVYHGLERHFGLSCAKR